MSDERIDPCSDIDRFLIQLAAGQPEAMNHLFAHSQDRLLRLVRQMFPKTHSVRRFENSSDVLQEVYLEISRALPEVAPTNTRHYLCLAAQRIRWKLIDLYRKHANEPATVAEVPSRSDSTHDPVKLAFWNDLHTFIEGLPEEDRSIVDLLYYQGMEQRKAAEVLNINYWTLKLRWQKVRERIIEHFGETPF
ncbi:MAG: sigma-70 family RNA polymerase sigma factor [Gemmataceae bacterium]|nr:sigma-70 family RNA polymerase sigma factor [Gemmataceae bacterium]MCI0741445.1 sigma-70 family RNA polymerase sigma factor [Gemmataceae bacterium]